MDQLDQPVRRRRRLRRLSRKRLRPRRRARGHVRISRAPTSRRPSRIRRGRRASTLRQASRRPKRDRRARLDRTAKLFIGGKQARPDSGYSYAVLDPTGREVGLGRRSAIARTSATPSRRRAKASAWGAATAHNRAQVLYYVAENLAARADEFARRLSAMTGASAARGASGSRRLDPPRLRLRRLGRQVSTARCTRRARASSRSR